MSSRSTSLLARRSIRSRIGRTIAIAFAIAVGVAFVVGTFVLADSLRSSFSGMIDEVNENIDLQVRSATEFDSGTGEMAQRDPVELSVVETVRSVDGVELAVPSVERYAQVVQRDAQGSYETVGSGFAPGFGFSWAEGDAALSGITFREGGPPSGPNEVAIDAATADQLDGNVGVGDEVEIITDTTTDGADTFTISGLAGLADEDSFFGASVSIFDLQTAMDVLGTNGKVDTINVKVADNADVATVQSALGDALPDGVEVIPNEQLNEEAKDDVEGFIGAFSTGLLVFAFITAFVSAFIINNVFAITIGQRLRELALLRAIGAAGRQVRRMIVVEAGVMSFIATLVGIVLGLGVARLLVAMFDAAGAGFPSTGTVLSPRTIVMAFVVGMGITLASVIVPARRAAKVPPVAAMQPELGFATINTRRLTLGIATTVIGAIAFLVGLFVSPGGTIGLAAFGGIGGLMIFLGVASVSSTIARPVVRVLGFPTARLFGTAGRLARDNAGRNPRRTSSSAAALMIGVALVSAAAVFATSLRESLSNVMDRAVQADYVVTSESFQGIPPNVGEAIADVPELSAVSSIRGASFRIDGSTESIGAGQPDALQELINIDIQGGAWSDLGQNDLFVHSDVAEDEDLTVGDTVDVTARNGQEHTWTVTGIYDDSALVGEWLVSLDTLNSTSEVPPRDFFIVAKIAEGVDPVAADQALDQAMENYPQINVQTNAEFRQSQEDQINQLLFIISALLIFAIAIAILGISITLALAVFERTREIGLLRAVGMSRRQTRRTVRWESVIVSVFGAVVGIVVGSLLGVALTLAVPEAIIETVSFSPVLIVVILVGAVLAGLIAALYPSYKASKMDVLQAITTE